MEHTNFDAAWRRNRLTVAGSPQQQAVETNFNAIADNTAVGAAATKAAGSRVDSIDVAMWYLATSGAPNATALVKQVCGTGAGVSVYAPMVEGETASKDALEIGSDLVLPYMKVKGGELEIGTPKRNKQGQTVGINIVESFPLPVAG